MPLYSIAYARVSTHEQALGWSLEAQLTAIAAHLQAKPDEQYTDIATGRDLLREGIRSAIKSAPRSPQPAALVVWRIDRLARNQPDAWHILQAIAPATCREAVSGLDTATGQGRLLYGIMAAVAEYESDAISQRTSAGLARAIQAHHHLGSPPLGQVTAPQSSTRLIIHPGECQVLLTIVRLRAGGNSLRAIADHLNRSGVPCKKHGQRWYASTIASAIATAARWMLTS